MRFFLIFLVFAFSFTVSASASGIDKIEESISQFGPQVDQFSKVSDLKSGCSEPSFQKNNVDYCNEVKGYTIFRSIMLSFLEAQTKRIAKLMKDVHDDQSFENVEDNALKLLSNINDFKLLEKDVTGNIPQGFSLEEKREIANSLTNIESSLFELYKQLLLFAKEINNDTSEHSQGLGPFS